MRSTFAKFALLAAPLVLVAPCSMAQQGEDLRLTIGKSVVIDFASDIRQISTSNPEIVDASPITTREILLHGKGFGGATMVVWNKAGQRSFYNISVEMNLDTVRKLVKDTFPNEDIKVASSRDSLSLTGVVSSPAIAERAGAMAAGFAKTVINNLSVNMPIEKQIVLRVKFAELDRNAGAQYGINILSTGAAGGTIGRISTGMFGAPSVNSISPTPPGGNAINPASNFTITDALTLFAFRPDLNLAAFVKALQTRGVLQILAEPNLVASNGKEAAFLVGGEFPVPVLQGGANAAAVTVQFKEFGIRLRFTPTVTSNKTIKIDLIQEVSSIDLAQGVSFNGFTIPALSTRRTQTGIELGEGQTFLVSGLIDNRDIERLSRVPGLGSIPVLGALFKSKDVQKSLSELVVMVTPEITQPLNPGDPKPMLDFPNEFLIPLKTTSTPKAQPAGGAPRQSASAATSNSTGGSGNGGGNKKKSK
jgi:pilus assembly protein CpaC